MRTAGRALVLGWLAAALLVLAVDGRLPEFLGWAMPGSAVVLVVDALARQQRRPSRYNQPPLPDRYRAADDLARPLLEVVGVAERDAAAGW